MPNNITCWGDSLTLGTGASAGQDFPSVLAALLGRTVTNFGVSGEDSIHILTRVLADAAHLNDVVIFWMGTNNSSDSAQIQSDVAAAVAHLAGNQKFLVLAVPNRQTEHVGTSQHASIIAMNGALATTYPNNYVDVRGFIIHLYDPTLTQDVADHAADVPPTSLLFDTIHLLAPGYAKIAARLATVIQQKGW